MSKAELDRIEDREGRRVAVYKSGLERDADTGRIIKPAPAVLFRAENAKVIQGKRQEKQAARLRARIAASARAGLPPDLGARVKDSADAFAEAGAMLFEQVVLESEAYPRDRLQAWETLGRYAGVLPDQTSKPDPDAARLAGLNAAGAAMNAQAAATVARVLADVIRMQEQNNPVNVIDG
jgi:hypothetical protein